MADVNPLLIQQMLGTQPQEVDILGQLLKQKNQFTPNMLMTEQPAAAPVAASPKPQPKPNNKPVIAPSKKPVAQTADYSVSDKLQLPGFGQQAAQPPQWGANIFGIGGNKYGDIGLMSDEQKSQAAEVPNKLKQDFPVPDFKIEGLPEAYAWIKEMRAKKDEQEPINPLLAAITGASDILAGTKYTQGYWLPKQAQQEAQRQKIEEESIKNMLKAGELESGLSSVQQRGLAAQINALLGAGKIESGERRDLSGGVAKAQAQDQKAADELAKLKAEIAAGKYAKKGGGTGKPPVDKAQEAQDKKFATTTLLEWGAERGKNQIDQQNLDRLMTTIKSNPSWFGRASAFKPDIMRDREFINLRDEIEAIAQEGARRAKAMDSQYAAREMDQYLRRKFNPTVGPEDNAQRLNQLKKALQVIEQETEKKAQYWDASGGTLKGFKFGESGASGGWENAAPPAGNKPPMSFEEWKAAKEKAAKEKAAKGGK